ncbi:MAG: hypothetical protein EXR72_08545 [Myxococcales bacterium]|nr:hypothetical protein [Myxococcales bacterium]
MAARRSKGTGTGARVVMAGLSVVVSLGIAELAANLLHRGAWPYLNLFQADARYGVRLRAGATTRLRSRTGRVTEIATNALGFRGPEWPRPLPSRGPVAGRVLLLGDSQVLGFGVEEADTFAALLPAAVGRPLEVLNAGVPSWGPAESVLALAELGPRYRPSHVVFVANAANDWFEALAPNTRRTTERDGWAGRFVPGEAPRVEFPGRALVMNRSHVALAVRELIEHTRHGVLPPAEPALRLLADLPQLRRSDDGHRSRLTASLLAARDLCRELGCTVVAVALPLDLQVDAREWKKYRAAPVDLAATTVLLDDFLTDAREAGLPALDLLPPLRAASPGAFLDDDYHLSSRGHLVVATALATTLGRLLGEPSTLAKVIP